MNTKIWSVDKEMKNQDSYPHIEEASLLLRNQEVVAFPTETVYGLGADATSEQAVDKIFKAKGRPSDNPLIVHIGDVEQLDSIVAEVSETAREIMKAFWPGPITLIFPKKGFVAENVTAGLDSVAVRMPSHPVALALLKKASVPVAAPSANLSGKPSPTSAQHVMNDLEGRISGIVDGGTTGVGLESTVLDCTEDIPVILRPGGVTKEQLEALIGEVRVDQALKDEKEAPKSPGMKYTHYAPNAPLIIVKGSEKFLQEQVEYFQKQGKKVGVLTTHENKNSYHADQILTCGYRDKLETVASELYHVLRSFNDYDVDVILSESFPEHGVGQALMNRLVKAAGHQFIVQ